MLLRELQTQFPHGLDDHDLELVLDVAHEVGDLLEQPVDARLVARLEQRGDGERGDGAVLVRDERLHVDVAVGDGERVRHGDAVERAHSREAQYGLGAAQEELQHGHRGRELARGDVAHVDDRARRLEDDHLALVAQAALEEVEERAVGAVGGRRGLAYHLRGVAHEQHLRERRAHRAAREGAHQLRDGQAVVRADLVQQRERVELHERRLRVHGLLDLVAPALDHVAHAGLAGLEQVQAAAQRARCHDGVLVHDGLLEVALDLHEQRASAAVLAQDLAQHAHGVGTVQVDLAVHVLHQGRRHDDHLVRAGGELLDHEVDHPPERHVLRLEELGGREEDLGCLGLGERLALVDEVEQLGDDLRALASVELRVVEHAALLEHGALFDAPEGAHVVHVLVLLVLLEGVAQHRGRARQAPAAQLILLLVRHACLAPRSGRRGRQRRHGRRRWRLRAIGASPRPRRRDGCDGDRGRAVRARTSGDRGGD
mmetsp:Transcript_6058/g.24078  ORF Transcript_6058/g.24078 Transcript_6058/m.24078 type:complete len:485 (-) Transcript_6058:662-2116(-)